MRTGVEVYEIDDEEFEGAFEEISLDNDLDSWRDLAYLMRGMGRLLYITEPYYTITVYEWCGGVYKMSRRHVCVCGERAERSIPRGIDGLFVNSKSKDYKRVCEEFYRRIEKLRSKFRPSLGGCMPVTVLYDPESRIFTIRAFNEYEGSAYLCENMGETRSLVKNIWTGETVILEGVE